MRRFFLGSVVLAAIACGSSSGGDVSTPDASAPPPPPAGDDGGGADAPADSSGSCPRALAAADRPRKVVISHPFGADAGAKAKEFEVLDLDANGTLSRPAKPVTFSMGTALDSPIVFTPDGEIGLVAQDDGSVGIFRLGPSGPVVLDPAFAFGGYAQRVVMSADGTRAFVLDADTRDNGGGVYQIDIGCDGKPSKHGLVLAGNTSYAMALLDPTKAVLVDKDLHLLDLSTMTLGASVSAFGDDNAIVSSVAVTPDGKYALVSDDGVLAGDRVAVVALGATPKALGLLSTPFPAMVVASPYDNAAIVLNDDSTDQIHVLSYDPSNSAAPFVIKGELAYKFGKPQIPVTASTIDRGALKGTVFVGENVAVRQLRFEANGDVTDVAKLALPGGNEGIVGVVGVQP